MTRDIEALRREIRRAVERETSVIVDYRETVDAEVALRMYRAGVEDAAKVCAESTAPVPFQSKEHYKFASFIESKIRALIGDTK